MIKLKFRGESQQHQSVVQQQQQYNSIPVALMFALYSSTVVVVFLFLVFLYYYNIDAYTSNGVQKSGALTYCCEFQTNLPVPFSSRRYSPHGASTAHKFQLQTIYCGRVALLTTYVLSAYSFTCCIISIWQHRQLSRAPESTTSPLQVLSIAFCLSQSLGIACTRQIRRLVNFNHPKLRLKSRKRRMRSCIYMSFRIKFRNSQLLCVSCCSSISRVPTANHSSSATVLSFSVSVLLLLHFGGGGLFPSISYMDRVATTAVLSLFPNGFFTL